MSNPCIFLYNDQMIVGLLVSLLGVLVFLFIFWKRLKEDYASEIVFKTAFSIIFGVIIATLISLKFFADWFLFAGLLGAMAGLYSSVVRLRIRFYETLEAFVVGSLPFLSFVFLTDSVMSSSLSSFSGFLVILVLLFIFYFLDVNYKNFTWYRSGRIGFVGLSTLAIFFLVRSAIAIFGITMLSFVGKYESIVSGSLAFIICLVLFNLGRKE